MTWTLKGILHDGRPVYEDDYRRELIRRPDGEWTIRAQSSPFRIELGTKNLGEAQRRAGWSHERWKEWRAARREEI